MNWLKLVALILGILVASEINRWSILDNLFFVLTGLLIVSFVWSRVSLRGLEVTRETKSNRAQVGQTLEERVRVLNKSRFPKLWVEAIDHSNLPGHQISRVVNLNPNDANRWKVETWCSRRGRFQIGPLTLRSGDPFGLFPIEEPVPDVRELVVYPAVVDLSGFRLPVGDLPGGSSTQRRTQFVTPNASGVRQYMPGDSFNRISWKTTARTGQLMVKEFELDPTSDIWIVVDMDAHHHARANVPQTMQARAMINSPSGALPIEFWLDSTEEYSVTLAASLANHFLEQTRNVGMIFNDAHRNVIPADRGPRQMTKILEQLAVMQADGQTALAERLLTESTRFDRNSTVVVISPSTDETWVQSVIQLVTRGVRCVAVTIEPSTFDGSDSSLMVVSDLAAVGVTTYLVKHGDDINAALSAQGHSYQAQRV
ncbi:MAG: DUF58 domain-containing protein [Thermomicrobiaceae bacterium]